MNKKVNIFSLIFSTILLGTFSAGIIYYLLYNATNMFFTILVITLLYGGLVFLLSRLGALFRFYLYSSGEEPSLLSKISKATYLPQVCYLIPSYKEEIESLSLAIKSSALQIGGNKKIVLLIDNPPDPQTLQDQKLYKKTINTVEELQNKFSQLRSSILTARSASQDQPDYIKKSLLLIEISKIYEFFNSEYQNTSDDFGGAIYKNKVIGEYMNSVSAIYWVFYYQYMTSPEIFYMYDLLINFFSVDISYFERKKYPKLSHAPSKAMNLNAYLSQMDESYEYIVTLDADTILEPHYSEKLQTVMAFDNKIGVIQTPYLTFTNPKSYLEKIASATTDVQFQLHQGYEAFDASYWVGANAMIRKSALQSIKVGDKYISDNTVIEDTESTIDLISKNWKIFNYPAAYSYSATPPDFGSLSIQRRRWANGGIIVLPKLLLHFVKNIYNPKAWLSFLIRVHYLISTPISNISVLLLMVYPFYEVSIHPILFYLAFVYYFSYALSLMRMSYSFSDIIGVYALNLLLIPVNLIGFFESVIQIIVGKKVAFIRTPKINGRVKTPLLLILWQLTLIFFLSVASAYDLASGNYIHSAFTSFNLSLLIFGVVSFMGIKNILKDLFSGFSLSMPKLDMNLGQMA